MRIFDSRTCTFSLCLRYIQLYKDGEDDVMYKNKFDYNVAGFTFMITTQVAAPNETMLRKMFPVKIV